MEFYRWRATDGILPMESYRWSSTDGELPMEFYRWETPNECPSTWTNEHRYASIGVQATRCTGVQRGSFTSKYKRERIKIISKLVLNFWSNFAYT